jgi:hypothetical protein
MSEPPFADDLLRGAEEVALFLFGSAQMRRKVYHLAATSNLPVFKRGSMICGRRSTLVAWITEQENRRLGERPPPAIPVRSDDAESRAQPELTGPIESA